MSIYFVGANILFDSGVIAFDENCCCEGDTCCMQVALSTTAACIGGTYNLAQVSSTLWRCTAYNYCFSSNPQTFEVELTENGGTWYITVTVDGHTWQKSYVSKPTMCSLSGEDIPHDSSGACGSSGSTCTLTANTGLPCPDCAAECEGLYVYGCIGAGGGITEIAVDLGAGGWTDDECDQCDEISGIYNVSHNQCGIWWQCYPLSCTCDIYDPPDDALFLCFYLRSLSDGSGGYYWNLSVYITRNNVAPSFANAANLATYHSSTGLEPCKNCFPSGSITLTKVGDIKTIICGIQYTCQGALPNTVTIADAS